MTLTPELLRQLMPSARISDCRLFAKPLGDAMARYEINTPQRIAAFIAQIGHESGSLRYTEELASGNAYDTRTDLGNSPEVDGDGALYKGRGLIMVTGRANYAELSKALAYDFVQNPKALALPGAASHSAAWWWHKRGLNEIADKPDSWSGNRGKYKNLDPFTYITVVINGGLTHIEDRRTRWEVCKNLFLKDELNWP